MSLHLLADATALASADLPNAIEDNAQGFALLRLVTADMEREAEANRSDNGAVEMWAGMLRWIVNVMADRNDDLRDCCLAAGMLRRQPMA